MVWSGAAQQKRVCMHFGWINRATIWALNGIGFLILALIATSCAPRAPVPVKDDMYYVFSRNGAGKEPHSGLDSRAGAVTLPSIPGHLDLRHPHFKQFIPPLK